MLNCAYFHWFIANYLIALRWLTVCVHGHRCVLCVGFLAKSVSTRLKAFIYAQTAVQKLNAKYICSHRKPINLNTDKEIHEEMAWMKFKRLIFFVYCSGSWVSPARNPDSMAVVTASGYSVFLRNLNWWKNVFLHCENKWMIENKWLAPFVWIVIRCTCQLCKFVETH